MPEYIQQEGTTDRYLTEDGSGAFLLETSSVLATLSGGPTALIVVGLKAAHSTSSLSGGGTCTGTGTAGETGVATLSGGGTLASVGEKEALATLTLSGGGALTASGTASTPVLMTGGTQFLTQKPKRRRLMPQRQGTAYLTGGGIVYAAGFKQAASKLMATGGGTITTSGEKQADRFVYVIGDGRTESAGTKRTHTRLALTTLGTQTADGTRTDNLDQELRALLEDALILSEA